MTVDLTSFLVLGTLSLILISMGLIEYYFHQKRLFAIPVRIHVNGTRGKSSVTRLIAAGLRESGLTTLAKTTGTAPRVIDKYGKDRVIHRLRLPSIGEQIKLIKFFSTEKPDAVVIECMALQPQYQWISEHQMIKSNIGVITNVRPDHIEEMGPSLSDIAHSLCNTVPTNSVLVSGEEEQSELIEEVCKSNNTKYIRSEDSRVDQDVMKKFKYIEHPSNVAVALDVCEQVGVNSDIAIKGMQLVEPDIGALVSKIIQFEGSRIRLINAMAANDPISTLQIWKLVKNLHTERQNICVFFNSRSDRPLRSKQMIEITFNQIKPNHLIVRGNNIEKAINQFSVNSPKTKVQIISSDQPSKVVTSEIIKVPNETIVFAIGNQVGVGQEILNNLLKLNNNG